MKRSELKRLIREVLQEETQEDKNWKAFGKYIDDNEAKDNALDDGTGTYSAEGLKKMGFYELEKITRNVQHYGSNLVSLVKKEIIRRQKNSKQL